MLKKTIGIICTLFIGGILCVKSQTSIQNKQDTASILNTCYTIGSYQICPSEKQVKLHTRVGGIDWDGYTYTFLKNIDYDNTEMYLLGNAVFFKEQIQGRDLKKALFIYPGRYQQNYWGIPSIVLDNDSIYQKSALSIYSRISIEGKKYLHDRLFEDRAGKLYVLVGDNEGFSEGIPDSVGVDKASVRHLCDGFYYDKSRIYYFGSYIVMEDGKPIINFADILGENKGNNFKFGNSFLVIDNQAFLRTRYAPKLLNINVSSVREYPIDSYYSTYLITDGQKVYINSLHYQGTGFMEIKELADLDLQPVIPDMSMWYYDDASQKAYLYLNDQKMPNVKSEYGFLMYSNVNNKVFIINRDGKFKTLAGILMPNKDGKTFRAFDRTKDAAKLKSLEPFTRYKFNHIFYNALLNVYKENGIDNNRLIRIGETIFYTDGTNLLWLNEIQHINNSFGRDPKALHGVRHIEYNFKNWVCHINNPDKLTVINDNMLTDESTLYYIDTESGDRKLQAVPFSSLGIPVFFLEKGKDKIHGLK